MAKRKKLKKNIKITFVLIIIVSIGVILGVKKYNEYLYHQTNEYKLTEKGYSLDEAKNQEEESYMCRIQSAIKGEADDVRSSMINIAALVESSFMTKYNLPEDYYTRKEK